MKKIALAIILALSTSSALAQTYACQFIMTTGMNKEPSGWVVTKFNPGEPFFIKFINGAIDPSSIQVGSVGMYDIQCRTLYGKYSTCSDHSKYLTFNSETMRGGLARLYGATQSNDEKSTDSVAASRFTCQKVG